jgi:hypothetical protein
LHTHHDEKVAAGNSAFGLVPPERAIRCDAQENGAHSLVVLHRPNPRSGASKSSPTTAYLYQPIRKRRAQRHSPKWHSSISEATKKAFVACLLNMSKRELEGEGVEGTEVSADEIISPAKRPAVAPTMEDLSKFKIFVGGVDRNVDTPQFTAHFAQYGTVVDSVVMKVRKARARSNTNYNFFLPL